MYGVGDVISALDTFELDLLDREWVNEITREKFTSCPDDLPDDYEEKYPLMNVSDTIEIMKHCQKIIKGWLKSEPSSRAEGSAAVASWSALSDIQHQHLLALLYFYIKKSTANIRNFQMAALGMKATEFYLSLLSIQGSSVYNIFQISIFEACMELFSIYKHLDKLYTSKGHKNRKAREVDDDEEEEFEEMNLPQQKEALEMLNHLLKEFKSFVSVFSLKKHDEALRITLTVLGDLTRVERDTTVDRFLMADKSFSLLTKTAYLTLQELCTELHGRIPEMIRLVLHKIIPNFSLIGGSEYPEIAKWTNSEQSTVRALALWFVKTCLLPLGEPAQAGLKVLIQHLCRQMTERADYRGKATDMVVAILSLLSEKVYFALLKWIFRESLAEWANHRVVAIELLSKLIYLKQGSTERSNMAETAHSNLGEAFESDLEPSNSQGDASNSQCPSEGGSTLQPLADEASDAAEARVVSFSKPLEFVPIEYRRLMLAIIIDRIRDSAASVQAKALNVLADILSNRVSPSVQGLVRAIFVTPYKGKEEIDFNADEPGFVKYNEFAAALKEMKISEISKKVLPGATKIVEKILAKCLEDRVVVRRAALSALVQVFKIYPKWMTKKNLELYGQHCRDPAMQVRKEMVGSVTELMLHFPNSQQLTKLWVEEVVPQVGDREVRVQEHALKVLTSVILANIKSNDRTISPMDKLPWQLLTHIASLKMRTFLITTCRLWRDSRTPELSPSRISAIMTHIGYTNDAPAWVLLASLSEFFEISDPTPILNYYLEVVAKGEGDRGIHNLVLITLNNIWPKLKSDLKLSFQKTLYDSIKAAAVIPNLVPLVVKVATSMTVQLAAEATQGQQEVAMWAMETVRDCEKHLEPCLDATNSSRGNCDACAFYLILLGSLADLHPEQINFTTFELIYSFLISAKSVRNSGVNKLKAISVVALSRMALREKRIASRLVAGLSTLISNYSDPVLLVNVIVSIADIGERFPNLIEPLVPSLSLSLRNRHREVREMALVITIDLLQEDYLKPRGALIYHLLSLINEPAPRTVSIVKFYFTNCLLPRTTAPEDMILWALLHYNKVHSFPGFKKLDMEEAEEIAFNMSGPKYHKQRLAVYKFLVAQFTGMLRVRCFHAVCNMVLEGVISYAINPSTPEGENLLVDTFVFLVSHEFRMESSESSKKKDETDDEEEGEKAPDRATVAKDMLVATHKSILADIVIPQCSKVRKIFLKHRHLLTLLYTFVRETVRDYKNEIEDLFKDDKQFGNEILHEIKNTNRIPEEEQFLELFQEANPQVVQAEVQENVLECSGGLAKRKSDEHSSNKSKKQKSGDENALTVADINAREQSLLKELRVVIENIEDQSKRQTGSFEESRKRGRSSKSKKDSLLSPTTISPMPPPNEEIKPRRRRGKASSVCSENSEMQDTFGELPGDIPPSRRQSKRSIATPTIPSRKHAMISSTPLLTDRSAFDTTDISPVVQNSRNEGT